MLIADIIDRLGAEIAVLEHRVQGALDLTEMIRRKALPNYTPAAFVIPNGLVPMGGEAATGVFLQSIESLVSVILVLRTAADVTGAKTQPTLELLIQQVLFTLCGWAPEDDPDEAPDYDSIIEIGVLTLKRGRVVQLDAGSVIYQLDFGMQQQLRTFS